MTVLLPEPVGPTRAKKSTSVKSMSVSVPVRAKAVQEQSQRSHRTSLAEDTDIRPDTPASCRQQRLVGVAAGKVVNGMKRLGIRRSWGRNPGVPPGRGRTKNDGPLRGRQAGPQTGGVGIRYSYCSEEHRADRHCLRGRVQPLLRAP